MPVPPRTWNDITDYITATYLNGELRCYSGQEFVPTGTQFFARRPIYKSFNRASLVTSVPNGTYTQAYQNGGGTLQSGVVVDTGGRFGAWMDPFQTGNINLRINGGGGVNTSQGGQILMTGYSLWPSGSGSVGAALDSVGVTTPSADGVLQGCNSGNNTCCPVIDLRDGNNATRWQLYGFNSTGSGAFPVLTANADGSGQAARFSAMWASSYAGNGTILTSVPSPLGTVTSSSPVNASTLNAGLRDVFRLMCMPPALRVQSTPGAFSLSSSTANVINFGAATFDNYGGWDNTSNTYTIPLDGLYLIHGVVNCQSFTGEFRVGATINGTNYWGPRAIMPGSGEAGAAKTQIFSLKKGDQVWLAAWPSAAANGSTNHAPRMVILYLTPAGAPAFTPVLPDTTYRWQAGTPGPWDSLFNAHIANDLQFLARRPYLMAYQNTVQTGIAMNSATAMVLDHVGGIVYGDNGDPYSGWSSGSSNHYTAPVSGWYLACWEDFLANPSLTTNPWVASAIRTSVPGITTWDTYQRQNMATVGQYPGAMGLSYYYLNAGDTITPGVLTGNSSNTTISTAITTPNIQSHFELVWVGE